MDLQIVRDEVQRRLDDSLSQVRSSEEKAMAQSRKKKAYSPKCINCPNLLGNNNKQPYT